MPLAPKFIKFKVEAQKARAEKTQFFGQNFLKVSKNAFVGLFLQSLDKTVFFVLSQPKNKIDKIVDK